MASVAGMFAAAAIGLVLLWPEDSKEVSLISGARAQTQQAEVVASRPIACRNPTSDGCSRLAIELRSGPRAGDRKSVV